MKAIGYNRYKNRVAAHFGLKVTKYASYAVVQQQLLDAVVPFIMSCSSTGSRWVDFGCGDGSLERKLKEASYSEMMIGVDIAERSLRFCRAHAPSAGQRWIRADIEHPPFKGNSLDGCIASSVLQWSVRLETTLLGIKRLLAPGGFFIFSLFIDGAFRELLATRHLHGFHETMSLPSRKAAEEMLLSENFTPIRFEEFKKTLMFSDARQLLKHMSSTGSTCVMSKRMHRSELERFCTSLEDDFGTDQGVPLTYHALLGIVKKGG